MASLPFGRVSPRAGEPVFAAMIAPNSAYTIVFTLGAWVSEALAASTPLGRDAHRGGPFRRFGDEILDLPRKEVSCDLAVDSPVSRGQVEEGRIDLEQQDLYAFPCLR